MLVHVLLSFNNSDLTSSKEIYQTELNNLVKDLCGFISSDTALSIGLEQIFFTVVQKYNGGNPTQLFFPIATGAEKAKIYMRCFVQNTVSGLYVFECNKI